MVKDPHKCCWIYQSNKHENTIENVSLSSSFIEVDQVTTSEFQEPIMMKQYFTFKNFVITLTSAIGI